jgi:hypothetical protein
MVPIPRSRSLLLHPLSVNRKSRKTKTDQGGVLENTYTSKRTNNRLVRLDLPLAST